MSDTVLTLDQLNVLFQSLIMGFLNTTDYSMVRVGWMGDGQPAFNVSDDIVYILVNYDDSPYAAQMTEEYDNGVMTQTHIEPLRVQFEIYGPNSFDNASLIRSSLTLSTTRDTLSASNLSLIPAITMPTRVPELWNAQWYSHVSFYAQFYELAQRQQNVEYIATANVTTEISE